VDSRAKELLRLGNHLFDNKRPIDSLNQEIALNFYSQRATFTNIRTEGAETANHLFSSYPERARQEFGNALAEFLRPGNWFQIHVNDTAIDSGLAERRFLEMLTDVQWRAMTDSVTNLIKATRQTDHDLAAFGNGVLKYGVNQDASALLFQNFHLRDAAWMENVKTQVDCMHLNWNPTAKTLVEKFGNNVSSTVKKLYDKEPYTRIPCRHVVMPSRLYRHKTKNGKEFKYASLYFEVDSGVILEDVGQNYFGYVVPRWQTVSESVYGVSMATSVLLPDSRTLQVMMRTLREAGEKYVDPPMVAVMDAIRGDLALYAGGVTTADIEYDERLGDVLRPLTQDRGAFPIGLDLATALKEDIRSGFFLDKMQLPETSRVMTATEVRRRIQEHIRAAAPISRPIQEEYNDPFCQGVFDVLSAYGAFPLNEMPESLDGKDIEFKFRSPLDQLEEQNAAEVYIDVRDRILLPAAQIDPAQIANVDLTTATRAAMSASGWKAEWFAPEENVAARHEQTAQEAEAAKAMQQISMAGATAEQGSRGIDAVLKAGNALEQ
jgi:hypothetical protein